LLGSSRGDGPRPRGGRGGGRPRHRVPDAGIPRAGRALASGPRGEPACLLPDPAPLRPSVHRYGALPSPPLGRLPAPGHARHQLPLDPPGAGQGSAAAPENRRGACLLQAAGRRLQNHRDGLGHAQGRLQDPLDDRPVWLRQAPDGSKAEQFALDKIPGVIPPSSLEDRISKLLGDRYELIELLGKGGFASVFRVRSHRLGRTEALKVLSETLTEDSDFAKRFEQEARVAASLDHPHIVKVYDYGAADDFVWFSMQYVDGPSVGRELRMRESFDELSTARIAVGVLDALQYSHARGVIHRDIKPDNILLDRESRPYLTDFGVAKSQVALVKTHAGTLLGSPAYMSPEQLQGKPLDGRSDLYSLGVTLYKMLAGGLPFTADDTFRATMKRLSEPPEPLLTRRPDVNAMLAEIVMRSLQRDVTLRYPDAEAMREDLQSFLQDVTPPRVRLSASAVRGDSPTPTGVTVRTPSHATPISSY